MKPADVLIIAGATASGKSAAALAVARERESVIINADSLQIYRDLPILTARPRPEETQAIPHALYGFCEPGIRYSTGQWLGAAHEAINKAHAQGQLPIVTGGTGLYLTALIEGLSPVQDVPAAARAQAMATLADMGAAKFAAALQEKDPVMAARIQPGHTSRLLRAWEVLEATGKSLSYWQSLPRTPPPAHWRFKINIIELPRAALYERCDSRLTAMIEAGALEEVREFQQRIDQGLVPADTPLLKTLGFTALRDYLQGRIPLEQAVSTAQTQTRQYAKRQLTWIRHQLAPLAQTGQKGV